MERLSSYQTAASPEIRVLAGGGLNEESLLDLSRKTTIYEFHMGRAVRMPPTVNGKVKAGIVRKLVDSLNGEK
jgi:copper homeostasis protein CutC